MSALVSPSHTHSSMTPGQQCQLTLKTQLRHAHIYLHTHTHTHTHIRLFYRQPICLELGLVTVGIWAASTWWPTISKHSARLLWRFLTFVDLDLWPFQLKTVIPLTCAQGMFIPILMPINQSGLFQASLPIYTVLKKRIYVCFYCSEISCNAK